MHLESRIRIALTVNTKNKDNVIICQQEVIVKFDVVFLLSSLVTGLCLVTGPISLLVLEL